MCTFRPVRADSRRGSDYKEGIQQPILADVNRPGDTVVPFIDLISMNAGVKQRVLERIATTIDDAAFLYGEAVGEFERRFAEYCGLEHGVGVSSGLDALRLGLMASGVEPGASVAVPAHTFAATFEAVVQVGARPLVVDISASDFGIDPTQLANVGANATHVVPVHLYGQMADMQSIADSAEALGLTVVEDACQAHGASRDRITPGRRARAAAFSFYPAKNLGAMGDAGALVTDDPAIAERARALRVHGETRKYHHEHVGYTARLDTFQAIALLEKLPELDEWNRQRREAAGFYLDALAGLEGVKLPPVATGSEPVWHLFVIRVAAPDDLAAFLRARGIGTGRHYPEPPHLAAAYRDLGYAAGDFPVAEALAREALSLPMYPGITRSQLEWVADGVHNYFG